MNTVKKKARRDELIRRVKHHRLTAIAVLPSLITLINALCGFAAICFASNVKGQFLFYDLKLSYFAMAGYLIFIAMIADMLDGRIARMSNMTSDFGGQLDSLCDIISFGVAPAYLVLKVMQHKMTELVAPPELFVGFVQRFIFLAAGVYVACAAIRLARFNVENEEDESAHMSFEGLPTPAAAGVIASMIIFYEGLIAPWTVHESLFFEIVEGVIIYALPFVTIAVAGLMVSRVVFPHLFNQYFKGRKPMTNLLLALISICLIVWVHEWALLICFCGFALAGSVKGFYSRFKQAKKKRQRKQKAKEAAVAAEKVSDPLNSDGK